MFLHFDFLNKIFSKSVFIPLEYIWMVKNDEPFNFNRVKFNSIKSSLNNWLKSAKFNRCRFLCLLTIVKRICFRMKYCSLKQWMYNSFKFGNNSTIYRKANSFDMLVNCHVFKINLIGTKIKIQTFNTRKVLKTIRFIHINRMPVDDKL